MRSAIEGRQTGFTMIELLVVMAIIGLIVSLILVASADGVRRAEERATQALITKLETALNDRLDALLNTQAPINQTHRYLASINTPNATFGTFMPIGSATNNTDDRRAQIIAQFDFIRAEVPDIFFLNAATADGSNVASQYPLNFAAAPYPPLSNTLTNKLTGNADGGSFVLPLGNNYPGLPLGLTANNVPYLTITDPSASNVPIVPRSGMFGASFSAAGGIYKSLYAAAAADLIANNPSCKVNITPGYDGVDNNLDGLVDELIPQGNGSPEVAVTGSPDQPFAVYVNARLANHTHKTARSEVLYAVLVEGQSPLGSSFSREDFTAREVQDTDGDGLPEFVDAWGEPLQFFRWPIYYGGPTNSPPPAVNLGTSDSQLGYGQYGDLRQARQQDPLDANQLLVSPGWWAAAANSSLALPSGAFHPIFAPPNGNDAASIAASPGAMAFMNYFHSLEDPYGSLVPNNGSATVIWDRGNKFTRREFFTKVLVLSAGPDREPGVAQFNKDYSTLAGTNLSTYFGNPFPNTNLNMEKTAQYLIYIENQAAVADPSARSGPYLQQVDGGSPGSSTVTQYLSSQANLDDITNHNISGISTGVR